MPLDHYIPQVHLKNFYSTALGELMYAIRKTDLKTFTPKSYAVCRIMNGSTNTYLREERKIEDFLKKIEPNYNVALDKLRAGKIDNDCIYTIAGFVAYVNSCSPASMRIQSVPLKNIVEITGSMMEKQGAIPPPPPELGCTTLTEALRKGVVKVEIDPKYPQSIGIESILKMTATFGNFKWEILHNDSGNSPFFTSDFPVAIEETDDPRVVNRIVPLAPDIAIRIVPDPTIDPIDRKNLFFPKFNYRNRKISHKDVIDINRLIVRCAEELVFYRDDYPWIKPFVTKNRYYRVEGLTSRSATPTGGTLLVATQRLLSKK